MNFNQSIFRNSVFFLALIPLFAVWGFWVTYFTRPPETYYYWEHIHGFALFGWCFMLVAQSLLIRINRRSVHRALGKVSYLLAPLVVISTLFLANYKLNERQLNELGLYIFGLQIFTVIAFAWFYIAAMLARKRPDVHARWMICTGLTMLDPIFARIIGIFFYKAPPSPESIEFITFAMVNLILIALIYKDWKSSKRRDVFLPAFGIFLLAQAAMLTVWETAAWKSFAGWFAGLPLT